MIGYLRGQIITADSKKLIINIQGVGYEIQPTKSVLSSGIKLGDELEVFTYLNVKEDRLELYGFKDEDEKTLFMQLISITGVGPKLALAIISHLGADHFRKAIMESRDDVIMSVPGVGGKNAKRIILELKGKLITDEITGEGSNMSAGSVREEAMEALLTLGFSQKEGRAALEKIEVKSGEDASVVLKDALKILKSKKGK